MAVILAFPVGAAAAGLVDTLAKGPAIGERIPHALDVVDHTGKKRSFASLAGKRGLILLFYRSLEMCPSCEMRVRLWNDRTGSVKGLGYRIATVTNDSVETLARVAQRCGSVFALLSDRNAKVIEAFGLVDAQYPPDSAWYGTAHPMIFVIDPQGTIIHRYSNRNFRDRPDIDAILAQLRRQAKG